MASSLDMSRGGQKPLSRDQRFTYVEAKKIWIEEHPVIEACTSSNQTCAAAHTLSAVNFQTEMFCNGNITHAYDLFTFGDTGYYRVGYTLPFVGTAATWTESFVRLSTDTTNKYALCATAGTNAAGQFWTLKGTDIVAADANDYLRLYMLDSVGSTATLLSDTNAKARISIDKVN